MRNKWMLFGMASLLLLGFSPNTFSDESEYVPQSEEGSDWTPDSSIQEPYILNETEDTYESSEHAASEETYSDVEDDASYSEYSTDDASDE